MADDSMYLVITGHMTSTKSPVEYVEHIVYGNPRIDVVQVGSHFVALAEYPASQWTWCKGTFERMSSFPHGVQMCGDLMVALREFGTWVRHYAPGTVVGAEAIAVRESLRRSEEAFKAETAATQNLVADMERDGLL